MKKGDLLRFCNDPNRFTTVKEITTNGVFAVLANGDKIKTREFLWNGKTGYCRRGEYVVSYYVDKINQVEVFLTGKNVDFMFSKFERNEISLHTLKTMVKNALK